MIRVRNTVRSNFSGSPTKPGTNSTMICGVKISTRMVTMRIAATSQLMIRAGQFLGPLIALGLERAREHRHEGRVERSLGEQPSEQVWKAEGRVERIGHRRDAKHRRHQRIAREAENARDEGQPADRKEIAVEAQRLSPSGEICAGRVPPPLSPPRKGEGDPNPSLGAEEASSGEGWRVFETLDIALSTPAITSYTPLSFVSTSSLVKRRTWMPRPRMYSSRAASRRGLTWVSPSTSITSLACMQAKSA